MMSDFTVLCKLGQGSFGEVVKVRRHSDNKEYALKKVKINKLKEKDIENALNEVRILASVDDLHIIKYKDAFYDMDSESMCIVMEFANGGDLQSKIEGNFKKGRAFAEQEAWKLALDLLLGLRALQEKKIIHRDIKSANVFFVDGVAKLGDMNVSKVTEASLAYTQTGTPYYASPEVWKEEPYSYKSDIWSFGCVLYEMCTSRPPFKARSIEELYQKVIRGRFERIPSKYSASLANFIADCLVVDVRKRANLETLIQVASMHQGRDLRLLRNNSSDKKLLQTIKLPKNLGELNNMLPEPCYEDQQQSLPVYQLSPRVEHSRQSKDKRSNLLDLFMIKKITPQRRPQSSQSPSTRALRQIKSEKYLPPPMEMKPHVQEPVSTKVLPESPSFKSILNSYENPLDNNFMERVEQIDIKRRERYEREKQYLVQLSAKKRPGIQLHQILPTINHAPLRII